MNAVDPWGLKWYNDWHYNRNKYNNPVHSVQEAKQKWIELPASKKIYHCMGKGNKNNRKFISPNGMNEAVFHPNPDGTYTPVTREYDPANMQTFNYFSPLWRHGTEPIFHVIFDVLPYWIWGNAPEDPTPWDKRVFGPSSDKCTPCNNGSDLAP